MQSGRKRGRERESAGLVAPLGVTPEEAAGISKVFSMTQGCVPREEKQMQL